jgi:hypothetical protein
MRPNRRRDRDAHVRWRRCVHLFELKHLSALPVAELVAAAGEEDRAALVVHMREAMRAYVDGYGLAVPQEVNVATARV